MAMRIANKSPYQIIDDPLHYINSLLDDIAQAKHKIYIEVYKFGHDSVGKKIRQALIQKAKEKIEIKLLVDSWGTGRIDPFFNQLLQLGAEVRAFSRIKININFFTNSHRRNHRKIIVIDDKISYIGSANLTAYSLSWRELILRAEQTDLALTLKDVFLQMFRLYNTILFDKNEYVKPLIANKLTILRDIPSLRRSPIKKQFLRLLRNAQKSIYIESPYFLPSFSLRRNIILAAKRGVKITVITPKNSDVRIVDILRNKYLGMLHDAGVRIKFYEPENIHAKLFMMDDNLFVFGSPNFDYRSFRFQHEIVVMGQEEKISFDLRKHLHESLMDCSDFDYEAWKNRSQIEKFFEWLLIPVRHLL